MNQRPSPYARIRDCVARFVPLPKSPLHILVVIAAAIFLSETFIMFSLARMPEMSTLAEATLDSTLLIILVSPVLYGFLFLPLLKHIRRRDEAEVALRQTNHLLQTVFDGISEPLILMDEDQRVKMVNAAAADYYGLGERPVFNLPCHLALMDKSQPCQECDIPERIAAGDKLVFERRALFDPDGVEEVVIYRGAADAGSGEGAIIVRITDITEAKAMEKQMRQRERMASLGLMISGVAHEINNPNNFISFNLPILKDYFDALVPILDAQAAADPALELCNMPVAEFRQDLFKLIENMRHGSQRINAIVSRLKDFSRIRDTQQLKPVAIRQVAERAVTMAHSEIRRRLRSCRVEMAADLPRIVSDGQAVEQVLVNLLLNACQAADKPDAWVRLTAAMDEETRWLKISVSDNGCGMDAETRRHIFDPLFTTNDSQSGTGLGLYIVHNLVENLEGRIEVESVPGQGCRFDLYLPDMQPRETAE